MPAHRSAASELRTSRWTSIGGSGPGPSSVTLKNRIAAYAPGLTPKAVLEKLARIQMIDVWLPATDSRHLVMPRHTEPEPDQAILPHRLQLSLPPQPAPRIKAKVSIPKDVLKM